MSVTFFDDFQRDPAKAMRKQLEAVWQRVDEQAAATAKAAREERYRLAYNARHQPTEPQSAA